MSENNGTKILIAFIAGAAVGAAIGYFLNSDHKDELINDLKEGASKLKNDIEENISKAKDLVDNFRKGATDPTTENPA
jgi:F0F1-type ATP synthase assembly protein I